MVATISGWRTMMSARLWQKKGCRNPSALYRRQNSVTQTLSSVRQSSWNMKEAKRYLSRSSFSSRMTVWGLARRTPLPKIMSSPGLQKEQL